MAPHSPHCLERPLSTSETIFHVLNAAGGFLGTQVALVEGPLDPDLLDAALAHVQERHPVLRARIIGRTSPRWTTPTAGAPPLFVARVGADPVAIAEAELHRGYRVDVEPLWRCTLVPTNAPALHHLILSNHHALADGRSAWRILADVLATCSALRNGRSPLPFLPAGLPLDEVLPAIPWSARLRHRLHHRLHEVQARLQGAVLPSPPAEQAFDHRRSRLLPVRVPAALVFALLEEARRRGATLTGALSAALLRALSQDATGHHREIALSHAVSTRELAKNPISPEVVGCFAASVSTRHDLGRPQAPWALAAAVSRSLRQQLAGGQVLAGLAASHGSFPRALARAHHLAEEGRLGPAALSNRGVLPLPEMAPFALRSWFGATGNHALGDALHLSCSTVGGDLTIGLVHVEPLLSRSVAEHTLDRFLYALGEMAEVDPGYAQAPAVA